MQLAAFLAFLIDLNAILDRLAMTNDDKSAYESICNNLDRLSIDLNSLLLKYSNDKHKAECIKLAIDGKNDILINVLYALGE